jgi:tetratricopeptide (TPR) repeat protein
MSTGDTTAAKNALFHGLDLLQALVDGFPKVPDYRFRLALVRLNLATFLERKDPNGAEALLRAARTEAEELVTKFPGVPEYTFALGNVLFCLGDLRGQRGDLAEARRLLSKAIELQRAALASDERSPSYRRALYASYRDYAEVLKRLGAHAEVARAALEFPRLAPDDPDTYRYAAIYLAGCVTLADGDASLPPAARRATADDYGRKAVALLRQAFERRLIFSPRELSNENFNPIRQRADFQALLKDMNRSAPERVKKVAFLAQDPTSEFLKVRNERVYSER